MKINKKKYKEKKLSKKLNELAKRWLYMEMLWKEEIEKNPSLSEYSQASDFFA